MYYVNGVKDHTISEHLPTGDFEVGCGLKSIYLNRLLTIESVLIYKYAGEERV
jgi:hypothetical protein